MQGSKQQVNQGLDLLLAIHTLKIVGWVERDFLSMAQYKANSWCYCRLWITLASAIAAKPQWHGSAASMDWTNWIGQLMEDLMPTSLHYLERVRILFFVSRSPWTLLLLLVSQGRRGPTRKFFWIVAHIHNGCKVHQSWRVDPFARCITSRSSAHEKSRRWCSALKFLSHACWECEVSCSSSASEQEVQRQGL